MHRSKMQAEAYVRQRAGNEMNLIKQRFVFYENYFIIDGRDHNEERKHVYTSRTGQDRKERK